MSLGDNIRRRRTELKLSQEFIADQLGVSRQAVSKWENGQTEPNAKNLVELAHLFDITVSELIEPEKINVDTEERKKNIKRNLEIIVVGAYTGSAILWTVKTNDPYFKPYAGFLVLIFAVIMGYNTFKLPKDIRSGMVLKELGYCILIYCMVKFLDPLIGNVYTSLLMLIVCVLYAKYVRFKE